MIIAMMIAIAAPAGTTIDWGPDAAKSLDPPPADSDLMRAMYAAHAAASREPCDEVCVKARNDLNYVKTHPWPRYELPCMSSAEICAAAADTAANMTAPCDAADPCDDTDYSVNVWRPGGEPYEW